MVEDDLAKGNDDLEDADLTSEVLADVYLVDDADDGNSVGRVAFLNVDADNNVYDHDNDDATEFSMYFCCCSRYS